ncbi:MAG TPA: condensation domain-containing protein, partial [Thermoanaerobaculia bacterium]
MDTPQAIEGYELSPQQRRLWRLAGGGTGAYRARAEVVLRGALDPRRLAAALARVVERHEILRTAWESLAGLPLPVQVIRSPREVLPLPLPWLDLAGLAASRREATAAAFAAAVAAAPFDLARGAVLRAGVVRDAADRHRLVLAVPALCADLEAMAQLVAELGREMAGAAAGEPLQYADYCEWLREVRAAPEA